jgi:hypothetical protein
LKYEYSNLDNLSGRSNRHHLVRNVKEKEGDRIIGEARRTRHTSGNAVNVRFVFEKRPIGRFLFEQ